MDDDEDVIGWEDDDGDEDEVAWEEQDGTLQDEESADDHDEEEGLDQPEERRWLGDNGEIVVELPHEDSEDVADGLNNGEDGGESKKQKQKAKAKRFTAEEIRQALSVHKAHLACLVARCSMVSRWAGDATVTVAMVSCLPADLVSQISSRRTRDPNGGSGSSPPQAEGLPLASLVVWFRRFLTIMDDDAVGGGGGDGLGGSRPARLLKVVDQRVGCAQEGVQLFIALCRGLGLRTRYVACLDPVPPFPRSRRPSKQTRDNTVDLVEGPPQAARRRRGQGSGSSVGWRSPRGWAEVLCRSGEELHVVRNSELSGEHAAEPPPPSVLRQSKRKRPRASGDQADESDAAATDADRANKARVTGDSSGAVHAQDGGRKQSPEGASRPREGETIDRTDGGDRSGRAGVRANHQSHGGDMSKGIQPPSAEINDGETRKIVSKRSSARYGGAESSAHTSSRKRQRRPRGHLGSAGSPESIAWTPDDVTRDSQNSYAKTRKEEFSREAARYRWIHVDPIEGAVDQADKVQDLRLRKRLMPYVVAEDENKRIVDVTRRYSSEWSRTLRTRGRAMASPDGWWNQALHQWGALSDRAGRPEGTGRADQPLTLGGTHDDGAKLERESEEQELQEKIDKEPVPNTIAGLKNHHMYVLGKNLLKFEALKPGTKAVGLVKGSKVFLKSDVAQLKGASRWKLQGLKVKDAELDRPAKVTTKKGEKEGEGTSKLYGPWQTERWTPESAVDGKVPKNEYGNVEFFDCSPALLPPGTEHIRGEQITRVAAKLGVDYAPALTGFETKQGRQVPVMDGIIVCREQYQMLRDAHAAWEQSILEKKVKARLQRVLRRWRTLFKGVMQGARILEEYGDHE